MDSLSILYFLTPHEYYADSSSPNGHYVNPSPTGLKAHTNRLNMIHNYKKISRNETTETITLQNYSILPLKKSVQKKLMDSTRYKQRKHKLLIFNFYKHSSAPQYHILNVLNRVI